jgi:hypothetical protein
MIRITDLLLFTLFVAVGFCAIAVPTAYGSISAGVPSAPVARQNTALDAVLSEAQASCNLIMSHTGSRVSECHVMEYPSLDVIVPDIRIDPARSFCDDAAAAISARFKRLAGKTWKVRVFSGGLVPPTAVCRVT